MYICIYIAPPATALISEYEHCGEFLAEDALPASEGLACCCEIRLD